MLDDVQLKVREWLAKQPFGPGQQPWEPLLGMIEEVGELAHAELKIHQKIRGSRDEHEQKARDAIGDITIFLMGYLDAADISVKDCHIVTNLSDTFHTPQQCIQNINRFVGRLNECDLFEYNKTSIQDNIGLLITWMLAYCRCKGWSFVNCIQLALDEVLGRDWKANPETGSANISNIEEQP